MIDMRLRLLACAVAVLASLGAAPSAHAVQSLTTGFTDPLFAFGGSSARTARFDDARRAGAGIVRLDLTWGGVAPNRPSGDASDPANPAYAWSNIDAAVRDAADRGLTVYFNVVRAPAWAEAPGRPSNVDVGFWRPDGSAYGTFARAAARRYSGSFPDPARPGRSLPRVRLYGAWNEANLSSQLDPQWVGSTPASPGIYRSLVNALYSGVKSVSRSNLVIAGETSPYGDPPGGSRMRPAYFDRQFLCLRSNLRAASCSNPPHFDILAHHPYDVGGPARRAINQDDVATPDMGKLSRILRAAERNGRALPRGRKRLWVSELAWDSNPPDPGGVPVQQHALWLEYAFYVLWRSGVDTILWFGVRDQPPVPSFAASAQSGIEFSNGAAKPAARAFAFPFVAPRIDRRRITVWGKAPDRGRVTIQRLSGRRWVTLARVSPGSNRVFSAVLRYGGRATLRARSARGATSLGWPPRVNLFST
jgi:hypothetical protein